MGSNRIVTAAAGRILLALVAVCPLASAQVSLPLEGGATAFPRNTYGMGLFAGYASGVGLSFRHHLPGRFSYQVTGGIIKHKDRLWYTIGGEVQFDLSRVSTYRVFVAGGGCSGFQYGFSFDEEIAEADTQVTTDGVTLLVDPISLQYLMGAEIDYEEGLEGSRFIIKNPNAAATCSCGSSFST